jgi:hypothetical protein
MGDAVHPIKILDVENYTRKKHVGLLLSVCEAAIVASYEFNRQGQTRKKWFAISDTVSRHFKIPVFDGNTIKNQCESLLI